MKRKEVILATLFSLLLAFPVFGQEGKSLRTHIVDSIQKKEHSWILEESESFEWQERSGYDAVYASWKIPQGSHADVFVYIFTSVDDAKQTYPNLFRLCFDRADCPGTKIPLDTKLANLGDENRMWENRELRETGIIFRRGRFVAQAIAPSAEIARMLAFCLMEAMNQPLENPTAAGSNPIRASTRLTRLDLNNRLGAGSQLETVDGLDPIKDEEQRYVDGIEEVKFLNALPEAVGYDPVAFSELTGSTDPTKQQKQPQNAIDTKPKDLEARVQTMAKKNRGDGFQWQR